MQLPECQLRWFTKDAWGVEPRAANQAIRADEWGNIVAVAAHQASDLEDVWRQITAIKEARLADL